MSIKILQPFEFESQMPNFVRDVINSSEFESQTPYILTSSEASEIGSKYDVGHIVWDKNTRRHYRLEYSDSSYCFAPVEPFAMTTQDWYNLGDSYIPKFGEIIIFTDYIKDGDDEIPAFKIGDGKTNPSNLPFASTDYATKSGYAETAGTADYATVAGKVAKQLHIGPYDYDGSSEVTVGLYDYEYEIK